MESPTVFRRKYIQKTSVIGHLLERIPLGSIKFSNAHTWVFPKIGVPQNGWFIMETPIKIHDFGGKHPYFWKHIVSTRFFLSIPPARHQPWELWHASDAITSVSVVSVARKDEMLRASAQSPDIATRKIRIPPRIQVCLGMALRPSILL